MIGFLRGTLLEKDPPHLVLEVNGVGYELQMSTGNFDQLPGLGKAVFLYTHLVRREDGESLYGFVNKEQRTLFRSLIKISNIGPKIALAILSAMTPSMFAGYLADNDTGALERIPGVGAKTAKRLIVELKDKILDLGSLGGISGSDVDLAMQDAVRALVSLGYKQQEAFRALACHKGQKLSSEELIRQALKKIK